MTPLPDLCCDHTTRRHHGIPQLLVRLEDGQRTRQTAKQTKAIARTAQQSLATQQASATDTLGMLRAIWTEQIETNRLLAQIADRLQDRVP